MQVKQTTEMNQTTRKEGIEMTKIDKAMTEAIELEKIDNEVEKKEKKKSSKKAKVQILTTREVADKVGVTPKALRRVLRAHWYNDGEHTNYQWKGWNDPMLKKILAHYTQLKKGQAPTPTKGKAVEPKKGKATTRSGRGTTRKMTKAEMKQYQVTEEQKHKAAAIRAKAKMEEEATEAKS